MDFSEIAMEHALNNYLTVLNKAKKTNANNAKNQ
jgi:hypothetical protein